MKKILLILFSTLFFATSYANQINTSVYPNTIEYINLNMRLLEIPPKGTWHDSQRAPMKRPTIGYDGNTLYLYGQFGDLTLQLLNNGAEEYTTFVPAGANEVALPNYTPGIYELQMNDGRYIYTCEIEIE